jgi:hypothetical protein
MLLRRCGYGYWRKTIPAGMCPGREILAAVDSCWRPGAGRVRDATWEEQGFGCPPREVVPMDTACDEALGGRVHAEPGPPLQGAEMAHFPKLRRGSRRRRAAAAEDRRLAIESLQASLERLEELDERVEALRLRYQPWLSETRGVAASVPDPVPSRGASPSEHSWGA